MAAATQWPADTLDQLVADDAEAGATVVVPPLTWLSLSDSKVEDPMVETLSPSGSRSTLAPSEGGTAVPSPPTSEGGASQCAGSATISQSRDVSDTWSKSFGSDVMPG